MYARSPPMTRPPYDAVGKWRFQSFKKSKFQKFNSKIKKSKNLENLDFRNRTGRNRTGPEPNRGNRTVAFLIPAYNETITKNDQQCPKAMVFGFVF